MNKIQSILTAEIYSLKIKFLFCLLFLSLLSVTSLASEERRVKIGGVFDLSSASGALWGIDEKDAFLLAIDDLRANNPGVEFDYIIEDSQYLNARSVSAVQKLITVDKVDFIIGPTWEVFAATAPLCEVNKVVCLAPSYNGDIFHSKKIKLNYSFTGFYDEREYSDVLVDEISQRGFQKVGVLSAISTYYETLNNVFKDRYKGEIAFFSEVETTFRDFKTLVNRMPKDLDAIVLFLDGSGQNFQFISQWKQLRGDLPPIYSHDGIIYEPKFGLINEALPELYVSVPKIEEPYASKWGAKFKDKTGRIPASPSGSIAYDLTFLTAGCFLRDKTAQSAVPECLRGIRNYDGYSGALTTLPDLQVIGARSFKIEVFRR